MAEPEPDNPPAEPSPGPPLISVIIVNWNGVAHLRECLLALERQSLRDQSEIIVVDNGSVDGSVALLESYGAALKLILNPTNTGFAPACNQGIRASQAEFVALLNNDAVADSNWLAELVEGMRMTPDVGSCTSKVLSYFDRQRLDNAGHVLFADGLTRGRGRLEPDRGQYERLEEVFCISGCAALLRRRMLDEVGLLDEAFFAYCEDADLGFRARLRGWRCLYVPAAVVYHKFSASTETFSPLKALNVERNRLWLAVKNLPLPLLLLSLFFTGARYFWQAYGALSGRGASGRFAQQRSQGALLKILLRAYAEAIAGLPRVLRQRAAIQSARRVSTVEVWRWFKRFGIGAREIAMLE